LTNDQWEITPNILEKNISGGISVVFSKINQGRCYIEANAFCEKANIKYAKKFVEEKTKGPV
jgi:hypothetical protein